jgi:hypothetical protein
MRRRRRCGHAQSAESAAIPSIRPRRGRCPQPEFRNAADDRQGTAGAFLASFVQSVRLGRSAHVILTTGVVTALVRFALLEGLLEPDE